MEGYRRLAVAVLKQLAAEARGRASGPRRDAREFIQAGGPLLELWCDLAGLDRDAFAARVLR